MSSRYAVLREVVTRCPVFVALVSSRGIELVVVSLGQLGGAAGLVLVSGVGPGVL